MTCISVSAPQGAEQLITQKISPIGTTGCRASRSGDPMWRGTDLGNMQQRAQSNALAAKTEAPKTPASSPGSG